VDLSRRVSEVSRSKDFCRVFTLLFIYATLFGSYISVVGQAEKLKIANSSQTMKPTDAILMSITVLEDPYLAMTSLGHAHFRFGR